MKIQLGREESLKNKSQKEEEKSHKVKKCVLRKENGGEENFRQHGVISQSELMMVC